MNLLPESWTLTWWQTLAPLAVQGTLLLALVAVVDLLLPLARLALLEEGVRERPWQVRLATGALAAGMLACVLPMAPAAEDSTTAVAEMIERPPGCLPLRFLVLQRLAEEDGYRNSKNEEEIQP